MAIFVESVDERLVRPTLQTRNRRWRTVFLTFAVAALAPCAPRADSWNPGTSSVQSAPHDQSRAADRPAFRLGDAAQPFGWSTAIADFNEDGTPDVAIVDRSGNRARDYSYRIEFSISGQQPRNFTFQSEQDAVTVTIADVDHDNDLDVVVAAVLSGDTVGIWLNDGHGRFTSAERRTVPSHVRAEVALRSADDSPVASVCGPEPRRDNRDLLLAGHLPRAPSPRRLVCKNDHAQTLTVRSAATGSRGPPRPATDLLS